MALAVSRRLTLLLLDAASAARLPTETIATGRNRVFPLLFVFTSTLSELPELQSAGEHSVLCQKHAIVKAVVIVIRAVVGACM